MATSQYSILRQYQPYVSPYNLDLIKDVMLYKQGKVDVNRERINQQIDYLMGQNIAKPEARAYFENKMAATLSRVDAMYRGADLSSDGVTRHIQGEISSVLDGTILNAIAGTIEGERMREYIDTVKMEDPNQYSAMNEYVALKPYYDWLNDGQAGSKLNPLTYVPYTDYNKELRDNMAQIMKSHKGTTYQVPVTDKDGNPTGAMMEYTRDAMTPAQVADIAISGLSENARLQMQIEAQYMADSNPAAFSIESAYNYFDQSIASQQQYINYLDAEIDGAGGDTNKITQLSNERNKAKAELRNLQQMRGDLTPESYSPVQAAALVVQDNFRNSAARMYAYDNSSSKMLKDPVYWERERLNEQIRANNIRLEVAKSNAAYREAMLDLRRQELEFEKQKENNKNNNSTSGNPAGGVVTYEGSGYDDVTSVSKKLQEDFNKAYDNVRTNGLVLENALGADNMAKINSYIEEKMSDPTSGYQNLSKPEQIVKYFQENSGLGNAMFGSLSAEERQRAVSAYRAIMDGKAELDLSNERLEREKAVREEKNANIIPGIVKAIHDNRPEAVGRALTQKAMDSFFNGWSTIGGAVLDFAKGSLPIVTTLASLATGNPAFTQPVSRNGRSYTAAQLEELQDELESAQRAMDKQGYDGTGYFGRNFSIYDYVRENKDGTFSIVSNDNSPEFVKILSGANYALNAGELTNRIASMFGIETFGNAEKDANRRIQEIRNEYIRYSIKPNITYDLNLERKDAGYGTMMGLKGIYETKAGGGLENASAIMLRESPQKSDDGGRMFELVAIRKAGKQNYEYKPVLVSEAEVGRYIDVGSGSSNLHIGRYKSGLRSLSFASPNQTWYPRMLESNGINPLYANSASALAYLTAPLSRFGVGFMDSKDNPDPRRTALVSAANDIMDNAGKFKIEVNGYDDYGTGYEVSVYGVESGERPEKLFSYSVPSSGYADSIDKELSLAPQIQFVNALQSIIAAELEAMIAGRQQIDPNGNLGKMLNFVNNE